MRFNPILLASLAAVASAQDVWCRGDNAGCLAGLEPTCYDCIHPVEKMCPGEGTEFSDCFCSIPSNVWTAFEKCVNDPSTACNDGTTGPTGGAFWLFNTYAVVCHDYNKNVFCDPQFKRDSVENLIAHYSDCDGYVPDSGAAPTGSASAPAGSASTPAGSASAPAGTSSAAAPGTTKSAAASSAAAGSQTTKGSSPSPASQTDKGSSAPSSSTPVKGAAAHAEAWSWSVVALFAAGLGMNAL